MFRIFFSVLLAMIMIIAGTHSSWAEKPAALGKEWSKSGFGREVTYRCKQPSCGGPTSLMVVARFGMASGIPELGIPDGSNIEAEFRRRPEVRRILNAMLRQLAREGSTKAYSFNSAFFTNTEYVGFNFRFFHPIRNVYMNAQLRISGNKAYMIAGAAQSEERAQRNLSIILKFARVD
jgi:hypothetical protein